LPDFTKAFVLCTDASGYALGAVLSQKDEKNREYAIAYASRQLKGAELNYGISEKECLAVVFGIKQFHIYLYGTKFTVKTDHSALKWLSTLVDPVSRLARWSLFLQSYDYEIAYIKGATNGNADALSRPVLLVGYDQDKREEAFSRPICDPYEDESLMYFLRYGYHLPELSAKIKKRVEEAALALSFKNGKVYMIDFGRSANAEIEIPPIEQRRELIEVAHQSGGHFAAKSTYHRIRATHYWRRMMVDIQNYIQQCRTCLRNKKFMPFYNEAQVIRATEVSELVGLDLTFGYPISEQGFTGNLVLTEYVSKYVVVYPIRSKTAVEVFRCFLHYCCIFGPPKCILTDMGKEFVNEVMEQFTSAVGIVHRHTSSYNPRTNGLTERFNSTFAEALRSMSERHQSQWHLFVPYTVWAYNTRVHSITGQTPYSLLFGREMNYFASWINEPEAAESLAIDKRHAQIRTLFEKTIPKVAEQVAEKQRYQAEQQNKRFGTVSEKLDVGSKVYLLIEGMKNKLEPRFNGPYTVSEITRAGNYKLVDANDKIVGSYPLHKLKPYFELDDKVDIEVKAILDDRTIGNGIQYKVRWADGEESWVDEADFNAVEMINNYWKQKPEPEKKKRGRPPSKTVMFVLLLLAMLLLPAVAGSAIIIDGNFTLCQTTELEGRVVHDELCNFDKPINMTNDKEALIRRFEIFILADEKYEAQGPAFVCRRWSVYHWYNTSWLFSHTYSRYEVVDIVNPAECWTMVVGKFCGSKAMICEGNECWAEIQPVEDYRYARDILVKTVKCSTTTRTVLAESLDEPLFGKHDVPCRPKDLHCILHDSTVVWEAKILTNCSLRFVMATQASQAVDSNVVMLEHFDLTLTERKSISKCNLRMTETDQGLFLTHDDMAQKLLTREGPWRQEVTKALLESEIDNQALQIDKVKDYSKRLKSMLACQTTSILIENNRFRDDEFFEGLNPYGEKLHLYANDGLVYVPLCGLSKQMYVTNLSRCYKDLPIRFKMKEDIKNGFLTQNGLIRLTSRPIACTTDVRHFKINTTHYARLSNTIVSLVVFKGLSLDFTLKPWGLRDWNRKHLGLMLDSMDLVEIINKETNSVYESEMKREMLLEKTIVSLPENFSYLTEHLFSLKFWATTLVTLLICALALIIILNLYIRVDWSTVCARAMRAFRRRRRDDTQLAVTSQ
jgi:hypothetical protein